MKIAVSQRGHMDGTKERNMELPRVSIIVANYNKAIFLGHTINSLINQTLSNIEVIIVDDGSTDNSVAIIHEYADRDHRIKHIIFPNNRGTHSVRRAGVIASRGQYVMFLDADDFFQLDACERACELMDRGYDIGIFNVTPINARNVPPYKMQHCEWYNYLPPGVYSREEILTEAFGKNARLPCFMPSKIFTRELAQQSFKKMEDARHIFFEDMYEFLYLLYSAKRIIKSDTSIYNYAIGTGISTIEDGRLSRNYIVNKSSVIKPFTEFCSIYKLTKVAKSVRNSICRWTLEAIPWIVKGQGLAFLRELCNVYGIVDVMSVLFEVYKEDVFTLLDMLPDSKKINTKYGPHGYCINFEDFDIYRLLDKIYIESNIFKDNFYYLGSTDNEIVLANNNILPLAPFGDNEKIFELHFMDLYRLISKLGLQSVILTTSDSKNLCWDVIFLTTLGINTILVIIDFKTLNHSFYKENISNSLKFLKKVDKIIVKNPLDYKYLKLAGLKNIELDNSTHLGKCSKSQCSIDIMNKSTLRSALHMLARTEA